MQQLWVQMSPGLQNQVYTLSIHIKRNSNFTNGGLCVHMSLNNNNINIQCFHRCRQRLAVSDVAEPSWEDERLLKQRFQRWFHREKSSRHVFICEADTDRRCCIFNSWKKNRKQKTWRHERWSDCRVCESSRDLNLNQDVVLSRPRLALIVQTCGGSFYHLTSTWTWSRSAHGLVLFGTVARLSEVLIICPELMLQSGFAAGVSLFIHPSSGGWGGGVYWWGW